MVQLADARKSADQRRSHDLEIEGASPRYKPGEFAAMEIALALTASTPTEHQQIARARRLQAKAPDAWDAWIAGDINEAKAHQISHALRKLERADSKRMLNLDVVVAPRPLTDPAGQLLDVAELGRFSSATLAAAIRFRDPVCTNPICHTAAARCDVDHVIPWPQGPTAAPNFEPGLPARSSGQDPRRVRHGQDRGPGQLDHPDRAPLHQFRRPAAGRTLATGRG